MEGKACLTTFVIVIGIAICPTLGLWLALVLCVFVIKIKVLPQCLEALFDHLSRFDGIWVFVQM